MQCEVRGNETVSRKQKDRTIQVATVPVFELYNKYRGELNIATKCASIMSVLDEQRSGGDTFCGFVLMCVL